MSFTMPLLLKKFAASLLTAALIIAGVNLWKVASLKKRLTAAIPFKVALLNPKTAESYILFGKKIDINTATSELLEALPGIGPSLASKIISYRKAHGPFASIDKLEAVDGIGPKTVERLKSYLK
ncbi:MAG: helix-hairpin-helix domain-containing protein [Deltaproteobacteria bacterium]|nr:helix-hairpin-helix domain-containing protein [Deltaproteobacteria bacterium]MBI2342494.1 helix-hairpin-helix domain-containing protein [Deltaproteobacteria bacterium]MBI2973997.1 helix-hairpin-helix domain-containing protein [Deltaproteobacteria bacterium]